MAGAESFRCWCSLSSRLNLWESMWFIEGRPMLLTCLAHGSEGDGYKNEPTFS